MPAARTITVIAWLTQTVAGQALSTFLISMVPVIEPRAARPFGLLTIF